MTDIGKEYGTALFALALEEGAEKQYGESLSIISDAFGEDAGFMLLLSSPGISIGERLSIIENTFGGKVPPNVLSFLQLLCEKGRMPALYSAIDEYKALLDAAEHVSEVKVTSAVPLSEAEKQKLTDKLETTYSCKVAADFVVDPSIIGGLIVEIGGKVIDGSLRRDLAKIKEVMNS